MLCWSRMHHARCYPTFNRFLCRLFLNEEVQCFGGAAEHCIVDNTSVVVVGGSGLLPNNSLYAGGLVRPD